MNLVLRIEIYSIPLDKIKTMAKKAITVRISNEADSMLKKSAKLKETSQANIIEQAIRGYIKKEKINF